MTLEKALEILLFDLHENEDKRDPDSNDAHCIGIEAVEQVMWYRKTDNSMSSHLLLHETK